MLFSLNLNLYFLLPIIYLCYLMGISSFIFNFRIIKGSLELEHVVSKYIGPREIVLLNNNILETIDFLFIYCVWQLWSTLMRKLIDVLKN
jgi:hypothetical protein